MGYTCEQIFGKPHDIARRCGKIGPCSTFCLVWSPGCNYGRKTQLLLASIRRHQFLYTQLVNKFRNWWLMIRRYQCVLRSFSKWACCPASSISTSCYCSTAWRANIFFNCAYTLQNYLWLFRNCIDLSYGRVSLVTNGDALRIRKERNRAHRQKN